MGAIIGRNAALFRSTLLATTISAMLQPSLYLAILVVGIGPFVQHVGHLSYSEFAGTGMVAGVLIYAAAVPAAVRTYSSCHHTYTYDALLAAPITVTEIVAAELTWLALCSALYAPLPVLLVALFTGVAPLATATLLPLIAALSAISMAALGMVVGASTRNPDHFGDAIGAIIAPLLLLAGAIVPNSHLPTEIRALAQLDPLYHCVQLLRDATYSGLRMLDVIHVSSLIGFAMLLATLATISLKRQLVR